MRVDYVERDGSHGRKRASRAGRGGGRGRVGLDECDGGHGRERLVTSEAAAVVRKFVLSLLAMVALRLRRMTSYMRASDGTSVTEHGDLGTGKVAKRGGLR